MRWIVGLCVLATFADAGAVQAERAFDLVFRAGTLDGLSAGTRLLYDGEGTSSVQAGEAWREVVVGLGDDALAHVEANVASEGAARPLGSFSVTLGNPVAMVFLERTVRSVAEATGGSPYYIRNRIRDALAAEGEAQAVTVPWEAGTVPATEVVLAPFATDARRAELGPFADLEIRVVMSEDVPGWYHSISAEAPAAGTAPAFASSLSLAGVEE